MIWRVLLLWCLVGAVALADTVRIGVFVGHNVGFGEDEPLVSAEQEARDLARLFQEQGDLSKDRTVLLTGVPANQVRDAIFGVEAQVREASARGDEVMLIFTYSGHASADGLHLGGTLLPMAAIRRWLETSAAQVRVAFVDACESGTLARTRGGQPVDAIEIVVDDALTMSGLAIITSTGPLSVARESSAFGGAVFTRALINGLRGTADTDGDGEITLDEAYAYAFGETVIGTASRAASVQRPEFRYEIQGVGSVVLTRLPSRAAGLMFPAELEGTYTVVSVSTGQVVARLEKDPGEERRLNLPTGRYVVRKVRREDALLAEVDLVWGGTRWVDDAQMDIVALGDPLARGGWNLRPLRLSLHATGAPPLLQSHPPTLGGELEARWLLRPGLGIVGMVGRASGQTESWSSELTLRTTRLGAGVAVERHLRRLDLGTSAGLQTAWIHQRLDYLDYEEGEVEDLEVIEAWAVAPGAWVGTDLHVPIGPMFGLHAGLRASLLRAHVGEDMRFMVEGQAVVGLSMSVGGRQLARMGRDSSQR